MGVLDLIADEMPADARPDACMILFTWSERDSDGGFDRGKAPLRSYCTDSSWVYQAGLLHGALQVCERATFRDGDDDDPPAD